MEYIKKRHAFRGRPIVPDAYKGSEPAFSISLPIAAVGDGFRSRRRMVSLTVDDVAAIAENLHTVEGCVGHCIADGALWALIRVPDIHRETMRQTIRNGGRVRTTLYYSRNPLLARRLVLEVEL